MHERLPQLTAQSGAVRKDNLLRKIWTEPQATLLYVLVNCPDEYIVMLFALGGITRAVARAITHYPSKMGAAAALLLALISGSISGVITYTAYAWGMSLTGSWLGGKATSDQLKTIIGWALVPNIASLLLLIPTLAVLGGEAPSLQLPWLPTALLVSCGLAGLGLGSWSAIILVKGVALVQGFGIGKSLVNVLLPGALLIGAILLLATWWQA